MNVALRNNIAKIRKEKDISQQSLADIIGIKRTSLSHIENGLYGPSIDTMKKISDALDEPIGRLFFNPDVSKIETNSA